MAPYTVTRDVKFAGELVMANVITIWGVVGAAAGGCLMGFVVFVVQFIAPDKSWLIMRIRGWLIAIGVALGFILGSTVHTANAQYSEAVAYQNSAQISYAKGDYASALQDYNEAIRLNPQVARSYAGRALVEYARNDRQAAFTDFTHAISLDSEDMYSYYYRGLLRHGDTGVLNAENLDGQIADFSQVIRLNPKVADAYQYRGLALYWRGQYQQAVADLDIAVQLNPQLPDVYRERADVRRTLGN